MLRTTLLRAISRRSPTLRPALFAMPYSTPSGSNVQNINHAAVQGSTNDNKLDPRGGTPCFANSHLVPEYASYNPPPPGFTAEEIMQFQGAQDVFSSVDDVRELLAWQKEHGSLERRVD
ncbi:hypothetical protein Hypma_000917 [Hypsizygus marmoreus]|uniref:Uncharacterized protein n=1 Tax=Hypsizygus marmoreus TaxID=39966 RepID=A0A369JGX6_HYPMA|nr:hypothetical protein Hypma_000917 [Hypsizygus marmoreus]